MAYTLIANAEGNASGDPANTAVTSAFNSTGANLLVTFGYSIFGAATISDSASNSWSALTTYDNGGFYFGTLYYVYNPNTSASHTVTYATTSFYPVLAVQAWSGATSSPFDQENGNTAATLTSPEQTGSVTPSQNDELVVAAIGWDPGTDTVVAINSSFTISDQQFSVGGQNAGCAMAYLVQTTAGAVNPAWSHTGGTNPSNLVMPIATFKSGGGPPPTATFPGYISPFGFR